MPEGVKTQCENMRMLHVGRGLSTGMSDDSCRSELVQRPGDVLAVRLTVAQAPVEDANQTVGQDPQRFLVVCCSRNAVSRLTGCVTADRLGASGRKGGGERRSALERNREPSKAPRVGSPYLKQ